MNVKQVIPRDAIPSVDDPEFVDTYPGDPDDDVIVVEVGGAARAYPLRYLHYHEIVNDVFEGRPIAVTWCPLCGSAVVYDRQLNGQTLEISKDSLVLSFGVSGKLADDDLVMYDRETESEWKQSLGDAIAGPLEGESLAMLAATVMASERFADTYPDGEVLASPGGRSEAASDTDEPEDIEYDADPYRGYFDGDGFGLAARRGNSSREWTRTDLDPKDVVLGITDDGIALGFPYDWVAAAGGVAQSTVGTRDVVVFVTSDGIHAFEDPGFRFEPTDSEDVYAGDGTRWDGATGLSEEGHKLARIPSQRLFAFTWQDDYGADAYVLTVGPETGFHLDGTRRKPPAGNFALAAIC